MKAIIKRAVDSAVGIDWVWALLQRTLNPVAAYLHVARRRIDQAKASEEDKRLMAQLFPSMTVLHGAFAGMKYPEMVSMGSTLPPKLLGSYEQELAPLIERVCRNDYTEIVDIGCAEGYYAVGLAMRVRGATVFAFDTDSSALGQCQKMAELNGVSGRITLGAACDSATLKKLPLTKRALILCDCEGFEKQLFNVGNLSALARHELLIEVHDFLDPEISHYLQELFGLTHDLEVCRSVDDLTKVREYQYQELSGLSRAMKLKVLREGRPAVMEWFYFTPKHQIQIEGLCWS